MKKQSRREFIKVFAVSGTGLVLAVSTPLNILGKWEDDPKIFSPSVYLEINENGIVTVYCHRSEMGQGVQTSLPMLVAEELEVDWKDIKVIQADADRKYGSQATGGSWSIRSTFEPFRIAGATAREMLLTAAAAKWGISASDCYAENSFIINKKNGKKLNYGELVADAAKLPVPEKPKLKDPKNYKIIGKRIHRKDTPDKIHGKAKFGIDVVIPGMYYSVLKRCPVFGGTLISFDDSNTRKIIGVVDVVKISRGVAVVATSTWSAIKGRDALKIEWDLGANADLSTESIRKEMQSHLNEEGTELLVKGNPSDKSESDIYLESIYEVPFIAHAPMEPVNAVADVKNKSAELWVSSQNPQGAQAEVAGLLGLNSQDVTLHVELLGGAFGRKLRSDFAVEAAEISKASGKPVKLMWTRDDDMKFGYFRPPSMHKLIGRVADGKAESFSHHIIAPSIRAQDRGMPSKPGQYDIAGGANDLDYEIPYMKLSGTVVNTPVPISWLRAVYGTQNPFAIECFIDEMAAAAGKDPYEFRRDMMREDSRVRNVLEMAAEKSGWYDKLEKGRGRGIACWKAHGSFCAEVAEVTVEDNNVKVDRFVTAMDCGIVINPDTVEAQIEGTIAFILSTTLKGEITVKNGGIVQSNYDDYELLTLKEMPKVESVIAQNTFAVGGVGEAAVGPVAPAVCNAIFSATGKRVRRLPIKLV